MPARRFFAHVTASVLGLLPANYAVKGVVFFMLLADTTIMENLLRMATSPICKMEIITLT